MTPAATRASGWPSSAGSPLGVVFRLGDVVQMRERSARVPASTAGSTPSAAPPSHGAAPAAGRRSGRRARARRRSPRGRRRVRLRRLAFTAQDVCDPGLQRTAHDLGVGRRGARSRLALQEHRSHRRKRRARRPGANRVAVIGDVLGHDLADAVWILVQHDFRRAVSAARRAARARRALAGVVEHGIFELAVVALPALAVFLRRVARHAERRCVRGRIGLAGPDEL